MSEPIQIRRYPNRRFYARHTGKYVSLGEIEALVQAGQTVDIRDSQSGEDLTRPVLARIIIEQKPEKISLFPVDMLHFIVRSNDVMADFLRDYFRHSLTYLEYLQQHQSASPMHWIKAWLDNIAPKPASRDTKEQAAEDRAVQLAQRVEQLEQRIRELESKQTQ